MKAFIGSCCEAFARKHLDEMESTGLGAILVDIDDETCYDLGKHTNAYEGAFESQTNVCLELLGRVLDAAM